MQGEILAANPASKIRILGVNQTDQAGANDLATAGRSLPWLQDVNGQAWTAWAAVWRDVVTVDGEGRKVGNVVNLTQHDLSESAEYAALKAQLLSAAGE